MTTQSGLTSIFLPKGFLASGINCGIRRYRPDLGLLLSELPATAAGMFTQNTCKAAAVQYCENQLPANNIRAIITNSGQANAATGQQGEIDNLKMAATLASELDCQPTQVLTASTGVIGEPLEISKICDAIPNLVENISTTADKFALAILTTDLVPKWATKKLSLSAGDISITGICKGSGMIHPNMATMLAYIVTDAAISSTDAHSILKASVADSFNMISVDGETSTNDSVFLLANAASGVKVENSHDLQLIQDAVKEISIMLAKSIVKDGEGASKSLEIHIKNAPTTKFARQIARSLTVSPLIKSAINGESLNWGRILARIGMEQAPAEIFKQCSIKFQDLSIFHNGEPLVIDKTIFWKAMQTDSIRIEADLNAGACHATAWGCDLSERYVRINADYTT